MFPFRRTPRTVVVDDTTTNRNHSRSIALGWVVVYFLLACCAAVLFGLSYWILKKSPDQCDGSMHTLTEVVAWGALATLVVHIVGIATSCISICIPSCLNFLALYSMFFVLAILLYVVIFLWSVILLARHECRETDYWVATIVISVLTGFSSLSGLVGLGLSKKR